LKSDDRRVSAIRRSPQRPFGRARFGGSLRATGVAALGHVSGLLLLAVAFEHAIDGIRSI
jgi:hypothetical protein